MRYSIRHGGEEIILSISIISSISPCGPRTNIDLTYHVCTMFDFYCTNYAIVDLPSQTSGVKIVYVRHFLAAIGDETSRHCGRCVCMIDDYLPFYDFVCRQPEKCECVLCCMQHPSLKSAASEIVFRMCNKEKVRLDHVSSCSTVEYYPDFDSYFAFGCATSRQPSSFQPASPLTERCASGLGVAAGRDSAATPALKRMVPG